MNTDLKSFFFLDEPNITDVTTTVLFAHDEVIVIGNSTFI